MSITRRIPDPTHPTRTQHQFTGSFVIIIHTKLSKDIQYNIIADIIVFFQAVVFSEMLAYFCQFGQFCRKYMHFLVYFYRP